MDAVLKKSAIFSPNHLKNGLYLIFFLFLPKKDEFIFRNVAMSAAVYLFVSG